MIQLKLAIIVAVLSAAMGCSTQVKNAEEQAATDVKQKEQQRPSSVPSFSYRPGAGLMIESP
jgi:hypothetical protein